jgi:hypothetical protein
MTLSPSPNGSLRRDTWPLRRHGSTRSPPALSPTGLELSTAPGVGRLAKRSLAGEAPANNHRCPVTDPVAEHLAAGAVLRDDRAKCGRSDRILSTVRHPVRGTTTGYERLPSAAGPLVSACGWRAYISAHALCRIDLSDHKTPKPATCWLACCSRGGPGRRSR